MSTQRTIRNVKTSRRVPKKLEESLIPSTTLKVSDKKKYIDIINTIYPYNLFEESKPFFKDYSLYYLSLACPFRLYLTSKSNIFCVCENITMRGENIQFNILWKGITNEFIHFYSPGSAVKGMYDDLFALGLYDTKNRYYSNLDQLPQSRKWDGYKTLTIETFPYNISSLDNIKLDRYSLFYFLSRTTRIGQSLPAALPSTIDDVIDYKKDITDNEIYPTYPDLHESMIFGRTPTSQQKTHTQSAIFYEPTPSLFPLTIYGDISELLDEQRKRLINKSHEVQERFLAGQLLNPNYMIV